MKHITVTPRLRPRLVELAPQLPLLLCALIAAFTVNCPAQTITGSVAGTVVDPTDLPVSKCEITLKQELTGDIRTATTNEVGAFSFPSVVPGAYTVAAHCSGFQVFEKTGNMLTADLALSVGTLHLTVGSVTETVSVTSEGAAVQTTSAEQSTELTATQLALISIKGRDLLSYMNLLPGNTYAAASNAPGDYTGNNGTNVNGLRSFYNTYMVDGMHANDTGWAPAFSGTINLDAVGEIKVLSNNFQAEYGGHNAGPIINMITKAGTKDYHGSAYWYDRNTAFNANDFFNNRNGVVRPVYRYNTEGATLGGPVIIPKLIHRTQNKLFFFYSFEEDQTMTPQPLRQVTMPTALERTGDFSQSVDVNNKVIIITDPTTNAPFPNNVVPASRINSNGQALLKVFPLPNFLNRAISLGNYNYQFQESYNTPKHDNVFRADYRPTDKDLLYLRGNAWYSNMQGYNLDGLPTWGLTKANYSYTSHDIGIDYTRLISSSIVNEFSMGVRHGIEFGAALNDTQQAVLSKSTYGYTLGQLYPQWNPLNMIPQDSFGGVTNAAGVSYDGRFPISGVDTVFNWTDGLSVTRGSHALKFGTYLDRTRQYKTTTGTFGGNFSFAKDTSNPFDSNYAYSNAVLGNFDSYTESTTRPSLQGRYFTGQWYAQDHWQVSRKLTLDIGMRFSWFTRPYNNNGQSSVFALSRYNASGAAVLFRPISVNGVRMAVNPLNGQTFPAVYIGAFVPGSGSYSEGMVPATDNTYPRGFVDSVPILPEPRFGFAYDPFGDGKTAIRGGFGIFHNTRTEGSLMQSLRTDPPSQFNPVIYYGNMNTFLNSTGVLFPGTVYGMDEHGKVSSVYEYNFGIQRKIWLATVLDVTYTGNLGRHLPVTTNINLVPYGAEFLSANADPTNPSTPLSDNFFRPYPGLGSINYESNSSTSNYNALQVSANRRFTKGVQFGINYTYSKANDFTDSDYGTIATYQNLRAWNYGPAGFDQKHRFIANFTWAVPKASKLLQNRGVGYLLDNWELSGVASFVGGQPSGVSYTTTDGANITGGGDGGRPVMTGSATSVSPTFFEWFNTAVFARPAKGNAGNTPKVVFRQPGFNDWDMTLFRDFPFAKERAKVQLRWETYNTFNHTQYAGVNSTARFDPTGAQVNAQFGQVTSTRTPRVMQVALRISF